MQLKCFNVKVDCLKLIFKLSKLTNYQQYYQYFFIDIDYSTSTIFLENSYYYFLPKREYAWFIEFFE